MTGATAVRPRTSVQRKSAAQLPGWAPAGAVEAYGERIALHATGEPGRPAVLLLHGIEDSWMSWQQLGQQLSAGFRCYAADLPWRAGGSYAWRRQPDDTQWIGAATSAVPEPVTAVIAHSFSANALLQRLASAQPADAAAVVLVSPFYRPPALRITWDAFQRSWQDFQLVMTEGLRARLGDRAAGLEEDVFELMAAKMVERIGVLGFLAVFEQFVAACDLHIDRPEVAAMVIAGATDPGIAGDRVTALGQALPGAVLRVEPDFTHFCHLEQPHRLGTLIAGFLGDHSPDARPGRARHQKEAP